MSPKNSLHLRVLKDGNFDSYSGMGHVAFKQYAYAGKLESSIIHVVFLHGALEYHGRHKVFIEKFLKKFKSRLVVSCMDWIGHGYSGGSRAYIENMNDYVEDLVRFTHVHQDLYRDHQIERTFFIGHGLGAAVSIRALVDYKDRLLYHVDGLILSNPLIKPAYEITPSLLKLMGKVSRLMGKVRIPSPYKGIDLTSDMSQAIAYDGDHLNSHYMTLSMMSEIYRSSSDMMSYSYYLETPTLFLLSGNNRLVRQEVTKLFISGIDKALVKTSMFPEAKHDLFTEKCSSDVLSEIVDYIESFIRSENESND